MAATPQPQHDDVMNDTPDPTEPKPDAPSDGFASQNLRTLSDVRRSSDDRIVAGVCAGVARHLNIDPILVRIAVVALTFIGLSGLILYLAAWFLLPEDEADRSVAADWFNLDKNEPQVRAIGLFVAAVLAVVAVVGDERLGLVVDRLVGAPCRVPLLAVRRTPSATTQRVPCRISRNSVWRKASSVVQ